ncbi:MAG: ABC transporter substrate-binding protein [Hydrogenothermaceae bacterium]|nr:ABC transporter substrate-binding protein [Hydrogenothermaceae bacterium]
MLYLARELGYIDNTILVEYNTTSEVLRGLITGVINVAALTLDEALKLYQSEIDVKIVMIFDYSYGSDVVIVKDYLKSIDDLKGKRIGVENTALGEFVLYRFLQKTGLKREDVDVVYLELHEHMEAFLRGDVDIVITFEPEKSKILSREGKVIFSSKEIPMEIVDVLVAKTDILKEN